MRCGACVCVRDLQLTSAVAVAVAVCLPLRSGGIQLCANPPSRCIDPHQSALSNSLAVSGSVQVASASAYSHSRGFYLGASVDSLWFCVRPDVNMHFYGRSITSQEILRPDSAVQPPFAAYPLYEALYKVTQEFINEGRSKIRFQSDPPAPPKKAATKKKKVTRRRTSILI